MISIPRRERKIRETPLAKRIRVEINRLPGVWASQNVVGLFYNEAGVRVRCGLGVGSPDVVGLITLGTDRFPIGVAFGLEVKTAHALNAHKDTQAGQEGWRRVAAAHGMPCTRVTSEAEAIRAVEWFRVEMTRRLLVIE